MPKHVIRIPPLQAGRRVSWTFEVSAAAGAEKGARAKKSSRKRRRAKSVVKRTRASAAHHEPPVVPESAQPCPATPTPEATAEPMTASVEQALIPLVTPQVAQHPPVPLRQATHFRAIALVAATFLVVAVLAFPRHPSAPSPDAGTAGSRLEPTEPVADLVGSSPHQAALPSAPIGAPVAASEAVVPRAAAIAPTKKALVPKPEKNQVAESTKSGAPIAAVTPVAVIPLKDDAAKLPGFEAIPAPASASISTGTSPSCVPGWPGATASRPDPAVTRARRRDRARHHHRLS